MGQYTPQARAWLCSANHRLGDRENGDRVAKHRGTVYFLESVPRAVASTPDMLAKAHLLGSIVQIEPRTSDYVRENSLIHEAAADLERRGILRVIAPGVFCAVLRRAGSPMVAIRFTFDSNHLNDRGARLVSPAFAPIMSQIGN